MRPPAPRSGLEGPRLKAVAGSKHAPEVRSNTLTEDSQSRESKSIYDSYRPSQSRLDAPGLPCTTPPVKPSWTDVKCLPCLETLAGESRRSLDEELEKESLKRRRVRPTRTSKSVLRGAWKLSEEAFQLLLAGFAKLRI